MSLPARAWCLVAATTLIACTEREAPPVVVRQPVTPVTPVEPRVDAGPPAEVAEPVPPEEDDNSQLPFLGDTGADEVIGLTDASLKRLLYRNLDEAAELLSQANAPNSWQVAILAEVSVARGRRTPAPRSVEDVIPEPPVTDAFTGDAGTVYVGYASLPLTPMKGRPTRLPINTRLEVLKVQGTNALVSLPVATSAQFDAESLLMTASSTQLTQGLIPLKGLATSAQTVSDLRARAKKLEATRADIEASILYRQREFAIDHKDRTRRAFFDAAWDARRADWVIAAVTAEVWARPAALLFASRCSGTVTEKTRFLPLNRAAPHLKADDSVCLLGAEPPEPCEYNKKALAAWHPLEAAIAPYRAVHQLQFKVDASQQRSVWLYSVPFRRVDGCNPVEESELELRATRVRRLVLPLGTESMKVSIEMPAVDGVEYGVVASRSEGKSQAWLRGRARSRWTVGPRGEPEPALGVGDVGYTEEHDVQAVSVAIPQRRPCECDEPAPEESPEPEVAPEPAEPE